MVQTPVRILSCHPISDFNRVVSGLLGKKVGLWVLCSPELIKCDISYTQVYMYLKL